LPAARRHGKAEPHPVRPRRFEVAHPDDDVVDAGDALGHAYLSYVVRSAPTIASSIFATFSHLVIPGVTRGS
jgi:hypothetical protein